MKRLLIITAAIAMAFAAVVMLFAFESESIGCIGGLIFCLSSILLFQKGEDLKKNKKND